MNHQKWSQKRLIVAKVFTAETKDLLGYSALNPVDLTKDDYTDDEPMPTMQSLPYNEEVENALHIGIPKEVQLYRPAILSIEGIIGVGKSEVVEILSQRYKDNQDVIVLREPSIMWENIKAHGMNLLDLSYSDPRRFGFLFQMVYFMAVERQIQEALKLHRDKKVIICERSLLSARVVYTEMIPELDRIKYEIYQTLFSKEGVGDVYPNHIILLDTEPRNCVGRVSKKDWRGDEVITLEYLQQCRRRHLEMKRRHSGNWTTIDCHQGQMEVTVERVMREVENIKPIEVTPLPEPQSTEVQLVSIEGNIGAGKSTFLSEIEQICKKRRIEGIRILKEPVEEWERITDGTKNILELFYENPAEYGFPLQILVGITTLRNLNREVLDYPDAKLILSERSILSSKMVFAKMLHHDGYMDDIEEEIYQMLFNGESSAWLTPAMMLYLKTEPNTCFERVGSRNRKGESKITMSQLERCDLYHKIMFRQSGIHVKSIDRDLEMNGNEKDWCSLVLGWCQQLMKGVNPEQLKSLTDREVFEVDQEVNESLEFSLLLTNRAEVNYMVLPIVNELRKGIIQDEEMFYLIKLKYDDFTSRIALPDHELTVERFIWEIEQPWPILKGQDVHLKWYMLHRDSEGKCVDNDLNESIEHIEGIDGCNVDYIIVIEIQTVTNKVTEETEGNTTIMEDGRSL